MNARTVSEELRSRRGWTETGESIQRGYGLGADRVQERFLPCCMLAASAVKAPRLAIPLASSNELTNAPSWGLRNRRC